MFLRQWGTESDQNATSLRLNTVNAKAKQTCATLPKLSVAAVDEPRASSRATFKLLSVHVCLFLCGLLVLFITFSRINQSVNLKSQYIGTLSKPTYLPA